MTATPREVRFGRYRLVERIGAGGMAEVHRAVADGPGGFARTVVIKRMLPELSRDDAFVRMLLAEGRLTALLHHPNIVQVHEVGEVDGVYYLAMEHVDGVDLGSLLRAARQRLPLPAGVACSIACELAAALAYAHARTDDTGRPCAIVHRDVSPANVMVTPQGSVKLLDFGIAKAADSIRDVETRTGTLKGKVGYMSPEQADGEPVDRRSDVFALGVVLYEMLTLQRLFRGDDDLQTLKLVRAAAVAPPSTVRPGVDAALEAVVMRMLARRAADRYGSCDEVQAALLPIARRLEGDAAAVRAYLGALGPVERIVRRVARRRAGETATLDLAPRAAAHPSHPSPAAIAPAGAHRRWPLVALAAVTVASLLLVARLRRHATAAPSTATAPLASSRSSSGELPSPPPPLSSAPARVGSAAAAPAPAAPSAAAPSRTPPPHAHAPHPSRYAPSRSTSPPSPARAPDLYNPFARP